MEFECEAHHDNGTDNFTLAYDEAGNLTDDGENYTYVWDAFYRLRKIKERGSGDLVAEYKYNGLGYRISIHEDTDTDGDVDGSDLWYHHAFDELWRWVGTFRDTDSDPKEEFLHHGAGLDGFGGASYIDLVVYRDRDANTAWTSASDGTLEERLYYCQNWRADVSALVTRTGTMLEWVKYSAYGVPFGLPGGDTDSDGDCDSTDVAQVQTWITGSAYDVRGDVDLDGDVDTTDKSEVVSDFEGNSLGRAVASGEMSNSRTWLGLRMIVGERSLLSRRSLVLDAVLGQSLTRSLEARKAMRPMERSNRAYHASTPGNGSAGGTGGSEKGTGDNTDWKNTLFGNGGFSNESTDGTKAIADGGPGDVDCIDSGESAPSDVDVDDVYVKANGQWCKYTIDNIQDARLVGHSGHFEVQTYILFDPGPWEHPDPVDCGGPGSPIYDLGEHGLKNCAEGKPPW